MTVELVRQFACDAAVGDPISQKKIKQWATNRMCLSPSARHLVPSLPARVHVEEFFALGESMRRAEQCEVNGQLACNAERGTKRSLKSPRRREEHFGEDA